MQKVVFLDRDGVINQDAPDYIKNWSEVIFIPNSLRAIKDLSSNGFVVMIITNQSAVGRGIMTAAELHDLHAMMRTAVASAGGVLTDIFYCPHLPEDGCNCRKPLPGLILEAQKRYQIDLQTSVMVGDSAKDIACARAAECGHAVLVKTGNGAGALKTLKKKRLTPDYVAENLFAAAGWIISLYQD